MSSRLYCVYCRMRQGGSGLILRRCGHGYHAGCIVYKVKKDLDERVLPLTCTKCAIPIHWRELRAVWVVLYHPQSHTRIEITPEEMETKTCLEEEIAKG